MRLLLIAEQSGQCTEHIEVARMAGWEIAGAFDYARLEAVLPAITADAAVLVSRQVDDVVLGAMRRINATQPLPVVLYTEDPLPQSIRAALSAGVSAYVASCTDIHRLASVLEVAVARFAETQRLKNELYKAKTSLAERKTVDKAKGLIMQQRKVSEDEAYRLLRKLAMRRNRRIGEVAGEVIAAADVLTR